MRPYFLLFFIAASVVVHAQATASYGLFLPDSVTSVPSLRYQQQSFFHRFFMGRNYRQQWQTAVRVPLFRLSASPFSVISLGGRAQTKSLQLRDAQGKHWSLRTVEKEVTGAVPKLLRNTIAHYTLQDQISSALPYGAVVAGELATAAGIPSARPLVVMVEADSALGNLNQLFAGELCMLEERDPGFDTTVATSYVLQTLQSSATYRIQQKAFLKARLLDMLIADWDRHADNWRWGLRDSAGLKWWVPIPRDRDWAFYQSGGALPWAAQQSKALRYLVNFTASPKKLTAQSWKAWGMDSRFLNELTWDDWESTLQEVQQALTDAVINQAVKALPITVYETVGNELASSLKSRRDGLPAEVERYYRFQAGEVLIEGSDEPEIFTISSDGEALLIKATGNGQHIYQRRFVEAETGFITINSQGGSDTFIVTEGTRSRIRLRLIGGLGQDVYTNKGKLHLKVSDDQRQ